MGVTDPIADMLTIIRNGLAAKHSKVKIRHSKIKTFILDVLKSEGYTNDYEIVEKGAKKTILANLKYDKGGKPVISSIKRISKPGRRLYLDKGSIPRFKNGYGITILTTPNGIISGKEARKQKVGGEIICEVW